MGLISRVSSRTYRSFKKVQKCLLNKFSLAESPNSKSRKLANFWEVKSTVLWLELVKSRVRPQRSKQKKKERRRPDEPLDEHSTIDDSSLPTALLAAKRRDQTVKPTESTSKQFYYDHKVVQELVQI